MSLKVLLQQQVLALKINISLNGCERVKSTQSAKGLHAPRQYNVWHQSVCDFSNLCIFCIITNSG